MAKAKTTTDRIPPSDADAERAALGSMMLDPVALATGLDLINERSEAFYDIAHRAVYAALQTLSSTQRAVDMVSVRDALERAGELESVGGVDYVVALAESVPSHVNVKHYCEIVLRNYFRRLAISAASRAEDLAYDPQQDPDVIATKLNGVLDKIAVDWEKIARPDDDRDAFAKAFEVDETKPEWLTGYSGFDALFAARRQAVLLIGGFPGQGKSTFAMNLAVRLHLAGALCCFMTLEMTAPQMRQRMGSIWAEDKIGTVAYFDLVRNRGTRRADLQRELGGLRVIGAPGSSAKLMSAMRQEKRERDTQVFFLDYVQLLKGSRSSRETRNDELEQICADLMAFARDHNVMLVEISQLNRGEKTQRSAKPTMADYRGSGALEQNATCCAILRQAELGPSDDKRMRNATLHILKSRFGPEGEAEFVFDVATGCFRDVTENAGLPEPFVSPEPEPRPIAEAESRFSPF